MTEAITYTECVLRGEAERPVKLFVDSYDDQVVAVKPKPEQYDRPLCFSRERVYEFNAELLAKMKQSKDRAALEALWREARLWQPVNDRRFREDISPKSLGRSN